MTAWAACAGGALATALNWAHGSAATERVKVTGFIDAYYGWSQPLQGRGLTRTARQFDPRNDEPRLAAAQLNIVYTDPRGRFGATISPWLGDNADLLFLSERTDSKIAQHLAQAFVTFTDLKSGLGIDVGKFYSWIGYESPESMGDDLYTRGLLYTLAQPVYHVGARANRQFNPRWGASLFAVNGWNQVERAGGGLTIGVQLRYAPDAKSNVTVGFISGREGADRPNHAGSFGGIGYGSPGPAQTDLIDLSVTRQTTDRLKIALNADYASAHGNDKSGTWAGGALSARYQQNGKLGFGARVESVQDVGGLRLGQSATLGSFSFGVDYWAHPQVLLRAEYRKDWSNVALFTSRSGLRAQQSSFNLAVEVKF